MMELMKKRAESRGQGQSGFTLIELLVVIAILAVLAGVVVFAVGGITDNSQDSACEIDERTLRTAVEAYRADEANTDTRPTWPPRSPGGSPRPAPCTPTQRQGRLTPSAPAGRLHTVV